MDRFAEVAVDAPAGSDRTFSYTVPDSLRVRPGDLVRVPFGTRTLQGVVFSLDEAPEVSETRDIIDVQGPGPHLDETRLTLARWVSRYYLCSLFEAAAQMLPPGGRVRTRTQLSISDGASDTEGAELTPFQRRIVEHIRSRGKVDQQRLVRAFGERARSTVASLVRKEIVAQTVTKGRPSVGPRYKETAALTDQGRREGPAWLAGDSHRAPRQAALLSDLLDDGCSTALSHLRKKHGASAVNGLIARGYIQKQTETVQRDPLEGRSIPPPRPVHLTLSQQETADTVCGAVDSPSASLRAFVLQGVTGSGKTEVYLNATERCLALGKKSMVLVPEIALTHQTVQRFASRFPGRVAILHSGLTGGERFDQWWQSRRGGYDVVIGSRSAVFAPLPDLGLIVLDEEHEWTYKQHDSSPRYHARDVAIKLAELTGAVVILGSASPDLVSYHTALRGRVGLLTLPDRVRTGDGRSLAEAPGFSPGTNHSSLPTSATEGPAPPRDTPGVGNSLSETPGFSPVEPLSSLPPVGEGEETGTLAQVEIVDMRRELREGNRGVFSRRLDGAMRDCLDRGQQMILFVNRRGSASHVQCRGCGLTIQCRRCETALTYHRAADRLICHYCGYRRTAPAKCPRCLAYRIAYSGAGTQSVADEITERFPGTGVMRLDSDATRTAGAHERLLEKFGSGEAQVLVGTQMVTKGLHFPAVTLVGVVSADVGLNIPDYRSGERVFQLLCQVAGRAGRGASEGTVIVQTYQPDNYAIQAAAAQDYRAFYDREITYRREQGNPPFGKLVRLLHSHTNRAKCEAEAGRLAGELRRERDTSGRSDIDILGPTPAYPPRLRGRYRWHIILRGPNPRRLLDRVAVPSTWTIDVDPVSLT